MQTLQRCILLLVSIVLSVWSEMETISRVDGQIVLQKNYGQLKSATQELDAKTLYSLGNTQVTGHSGFAVPADAVQLAADKDAPFTITVQGSEPTVINISSLLEKDTLLPKLIKGREYTEPVTKLYNDVPVKACYVSPIYKVSSQKIHYYRKLTITVQYTPPVGNQIANQSLKKRLSGIVLNPDELRYGKKQRARAPFVKRWDPGDKLLRFSVDNGISPSDSRETDVEHTCNGIYALMAEDLTYLGANIPFSQIAVHASNRHIIDSLVPKEDEIPEGVVPVALHWDDKNGDGLLNGDDRILFYGSALHYWYWDSLQGDWDFSYSIYDYKRYYWISLTGGRRMQRFASKEGGAPESKGVKFKRVQINKSLITPDDKHKGNSKRFWKWQTISSSMNAFTQDITTFNVAENDLVGIRLYAPKRKMASLFLDMGGESQGVHFDDKMSNWVYGPGTSSRFTCRGQYSSSNSYADIGGYDTRYMRYLTMGSASLPLHFYSKPEKMFLRYAVSELPTESVWGFRINELSEDVTCMGKVNSKTYTFSDSSGEGYEYYFAPESSFKRPQLEVVSLHESGFIKRKIGAVTGNHSYIIVTSPELEKHADSMAAIKQSEGYSPLVLSTVDIYRQFSGGSATPAAIRNALIYLRAKNGPIEYLVLFGGGHYDYKKIITSEENHIFPYLCGGAVFEDYYAVLDSGESFGTGGGADCMVGRVPAKNSEEAANYLQKLRETTFCTTAENNWRNRVLLVSDDFYQSIGPEYMKHCTNNDSVFAVIRRGRPDVDVKMVNLLEYQFESSQKPKAAAALMSYLNEGCAYANYFGHGAFETVADEAILVIEDLNSFNNKGKYFFFSFFSCAVGFFDLPDRRDIASELVVLPQKGAIATWACSRSSLNSNNATAGRTMYETIFGDSAEIAPIGEATFAVKEKRVNNKYILFGDPSYRPYKKREILDMSVSNSDGTPLKRCRIFDEIKVKASVPASFLNGYATISLQNPTRFGERPKDGEKSSHISPKLTYTLPGDVIYSSDSISLEKGYIDQTIKIPRSVKQDTSGVILKLSCTGNGKLSAVAYSEFIVSGVNLEGIDTTDKVGPQIKVRLQTGIENSSCDFADAGPVIEVDGFRNEEKGFVGHDGEVVMKKYSFVTLDVVFADKSGVDHYYDKAGEGISLSIDEILPMTSMNEHFQSVKGDSLGRISLVLDRAQFPGKGEYEMMIQATDILGNQSSERYILDVISTGDEKYTIGELFCFPCPVSRRKGETRFWFNELSGSVKRAVLKIYTLDGRLLRVVKDFNSGYRWDLRDERGNLLSPNVYLYRLFVELEAENSFDDSEDGEVIKSAIRKITILP